MYDKNLYQHFFGVRVVTPRNKLAAERLKRNNLSHISNPEPNNMVKIYFEGIGKSIPVTLRYFDRLLNDHSLVCIKKRWICVD